MVAIVDLKAEFARLKMLEGRTPTSSEAEWRGIRQARTLSRRRDFHREVRRHERLGAASHRR
jgi:hypothetical protein